MSPALRKAVVPAAVAIVALGASGAAGAGFTFAGFTFGTSGSGPGQFDEPHGVGVSPSGDVYVADHRNDRIQRFTREGSFVTSWAVSAYPNAVAADNSGVYVTSIPGRPPGNEGAAVRKYSPSGTLLWESVSSGEAVNGDAYSATLSGDRLYVSLINSRKIRSYDTSSGAMTAEWTMPDAVSGGLAPRPGGGLYAVDWGGPPRTPRRIRTVDGSGAVTGTFLEQPAWSCLRIASDSAGNVFVDANVDATVIRVYSAAGAQVGSIPWDANAGCAHLAIFDGYLYASQPGLGRIKVVDLGTPTVSVATSDARPFAGSPISLEATASVYTGRIERYEWDLDGDGAKETTSTGPSVTASFRKPGAVTVSVRAVGSSGRAAEATVGIQAFLAPPAGEPGISVNEGEEYTNDPKVTLWPVWPAGATEMRISNDGGFRNAEVRSLGEKVAWTLKSSGDERLPKTVYVRFSGSDIDTTKTYQDDIILDLTPPIVAATATSSGSSAKERTEDAKKKTKRPPLVRLQVKATDALSGVGKMQVTDLKAKPGPERAYLTSVTLRTKRKAVHVRAQDRAGNWSAWRTARVKVKR